jgi:hypothetical protein
MEKIQLRLRNEELGQLRKMAARSGRSVAELLREAVGTVMLNPSAKGPVAIWSGRPRRTALAHDTVHDEL